MCRSNIKGEVIKFSLKPVNVISDMFLSLFT